MRIISVIDYFYSLCLIFIIIFIGNLLNVSDLKFVDLKAFRVISQLGKKLCVIVYNKTGSLNFGTWLIIEKTIKVKQTIKR